LTALEIAKELVQRVVTTLTVVRMVAILALAQGVVHIAVGVRVCSLRGRVWLIILGSGVVCILAIDAVDGAFKVMGGSSVSLGVLSEHHIRVFHTRFRGPDLGIVGMSLDMLLQVLGALERLATEITLMRLQWHMHSDV
jgi:hypothetical protein